METNREKYTVPSWILAWAIVGLLVLGILYGRSVHAQSRHAPEHITIGDTSKQQMFMCSKKEHMATLLEAGAAGQEALRTAIVKMQTEHHGECGRVVGVVRLVEGHEQYTLNGDPVWIIEVAVLAVMNPMRQLMPLSVPVQQFGMSHLPVLSEEEAEVANIRKMSI